MYLIPQRRLLMVVCLASMFIPQAEARPSWLPPHFSIPSDTISPNGRYGVELPDAEVDTPNKLVDLKTGEVVANLAGVPGWYKGPGYSMRWGDMEAEWSRDSTTLCWIQPGKWFPASYVVLKLRDGQLAWQIELMKAADREILSRTEAAAPLNFAITKLDNAGDGSAYPEGFAIDVSEPGDTFSLPLVCDVTLTSDSKASEDVPEENGVRAWLTMTVGTDGSLTYSGFRVKKGALSSDAAKKIKTNTASVPLIETDLGKAMLFPELSSKDGRYAVAWTVRAARKGEPPVDWSHWDPSDPDKVLRLYDWQHYGYMDGEIFPYEAVDFILDTHNGKTAILPTKLPNWPGKKDGWQMAARWFSEADGRKFALVASDQDDSEIGNFWIVTLSDQQMLVKDLTTTMRKVVNDLLRGRRPEVAASDFLVSYPLRIGEGTADKGGTVEVPFVANAPSSDQTEFQLSGTVAILLSEGSVLGASSDEKRLEPFVNNEKLRKADETLNTMFQGALKSMSPVDAQTLKRQERDWIAQRDADASQAVNIMPYGSTQQACEKARENSLLKSTEKRIEELKHQLR